jgi:hypothetical protein
MRRSAAAWLLLAAVGGCMSGGGTYPGGANGPGCYSAYGPGRCPPAVPGFQGPWGQPVPMTAPYSAHPPGALAAQAMIAQSVPLDLVARGPAGANPSGIQQVAYTPATPPGTCPPGGCPAGPAAAMPWMPPGGYLAPPGVPVAPGMAPGGPVGPPLPPVPPGPPLLAGMPSFPPGAVAAAGALTAAPHPRFPVQRTQVRFVGPAGMKVAWYTVTPDGKAGFSDTALEVPGRYNFLQAAIYRLKLSNIPGQPGLEVYPTLEVVPANPRTEEFLAHSYVPVQFTQEDFRQVASGNYLVKVIYLPRREYQDQALLPPGEIVSTQLPPGTDPITEALRRGDILLVIRMGGIDQEAPNTPPLTAPGAVPMPAPMSPALPPAAYGPGMPPAGRMVPYMLPAPPAGPAPGAFPPGAMPTQQLPPVAPRATNGTGPVSRLPDPDSLRAGNAATIPAAATTSPNP